MDILDACAHEDAVETHELDDEPPDGVGTNLGIHRPVAGFTREHRWVPVHPVRGMGPGLKQVDPADRWLQDNGIRRVHRSPSGRLRGPDLDPYPAFPSIGVINECRIEEVDHLNGDREFLEEPSPLHSDHHDIPSVAPARRCSERWNASAMPPGLDLDPERGAEPPPQVRAAAASQARPHSQGLERPSGRSPRSARRSRRRGPSVTILPSPAWTVWAGSGRWSASPTMMPPRIQRQVLAARRV